ncbi:hypothetical protein VQL36_16670 [Chengkuizengella sp. SCS-71B]
MKSKIAKCLSVVLSVFAIVFTYSNKLVFGDSIIPEKLIKKD